MGMAGAIRLSHFFITSMGCEGFEPQKSKKV
jgi:hypothetical protein